jgi:phosphate transport system substrate-binding protein
MVLKEYFVLLLCFAVISGCNSTKSKKPADVQTESAKTELSGTISISGAYALYPLAQKWAEDFMKIHPGVRIEVSENGTGQGIADLINRKVQVAMISRVLSDAEQDTGIWVIPVARDGVAPIVNQKNPFIKRIIREGIAPDKLIRLYTMEAPVTWGELLDTISKEKVIVYTRADESGAAAIWANFLYKEEKDLKGIKVNGDPEMIRSIQNNPLAFGFCNFSFAFDEKTGERINGIQVIPIDLDFDHVIDRNEIPFSNIARTHRGIWLGYYPKNLCRELTFGTLGKPTDMVIIEFLKYVLSKGQEVVINSNFCELNDVYIRYALETLE